MTLGAGCAGARATSSAKGTPSNRSRRSSTDPLPLEAAVAGRARRGAGLRRATGGRRAGAALGHFGVALRALVPLLCLGALLLDPADAAVPVCAHVRAPAAFCQPEVVPPAPRRCSLGAPVHDHYDHNQTLVPESFLAIHSRHGRALRPRAEIEARHELCEDVALHATAFLASRHLEGDDTSE